MARARDARGKIATIKIPSCEITQIRKPNIGQRDIDIAPLPGLARIENAGNDRQRHTITGGVVDNRKPETRRRRIGFPVEREIAGFGLDEIIVAWPVCTAAVPSVSREMTANNSWIDCTQRLISQAQLSRHVATQITSYRVRTFDELLENGLSLR